MLCGGVQRGLNHEATEHAPVRSFIYHSLGILRSVLKAVNTICGGVQRGVNNEAIELASVRSFIYHNLSIVCSP